MATQDLRILKRQLAIAQVAMENSTDATWASAVHAWEEAGHKLAKALGEEQSREGR